MQELVTMEEFKANVTLRQGTVFVYCTAIWCGPCRSFGPVIKAIAKEYEARTDLGSKKPVFFKVDLEKARDIVLVMGVRSIPTLQVFHEGRSCNQLVGAVKEEEARKFIEKNL